MEKWLDTTLGLTGTDSLVVEPLPGDASVRQYTRIHHNGDGYILMQAPVDKAFEQFVLVGKLLSSYGVNVPRVLRSDLQRGYILMSDFGTAHYLDELTDVTADHLYGLALEAVVAFQTIPYKSTLPRFDVAWMNAQMQTCFWPWYVERHCQRTISKSLKDQVDGVIRIVLECVQQQPKVFVHLDYHSRNLMVLPEHSPGILDFQDAGWGPLTYDLVSLFQDCYIDWPRPKIEQWLKEYFEGSAYPKTIGWELFLKYFDFTGVQRHLKNLGVFARLHHRDGKSRYLGDMPRVIGYLRSACERYPELTPIEELLCEP